MGWRLDTFASLRRVGRSVSTDPACCAEFGAHRAPYETENQRLRIARINSVPFFILYCCKEISPQAVARSDFSDYTCAARKSNYCSEISQ
jgi:hypothetical protein